MDRNLLISFFESKATLEEEMRIREWMEASDENHQIFMSERKLFDAMMLLPDEKVITSYNEPRIWQKPWMKEFFKVAAVIIFTLSAVMSYQYMFNDKEDLLAMQKIMVPSGQRISMELADGTIVWLNSRSSIQYPASFKGDTRKVVLDGEAYFEVAHNKEKPFIVETPRGIIEVLGTKFNVEAYSDNERFVTSLMEGSVKIESSGKQLLLEPDQMAFLENGQLAKSQIEDYNMYRWREGLICFRNETFANIMKKFETCYGVTIQIENGISINARYTGKFRQSDGITYALRVLQKDLMFSFVRDEDNHIIYIKK